MIYLLCPVCLRDSYISPMYVAPSAPGYNSRCLQRVDPFTVAPDIAGTWECYSFGRLSSFSCKLHLENCSVLYYTLPLFIFQALFWYFVNTLKCRCLFSFSDIGQNRDQKCQSHCHDHRKFVKRKLNTLQRKWRNKTFHRGFSLLDKCILHSQINRIIH